MVDTYYGSCGSRLSGLFRLVGLYLRSCLQCFAILVDFRRIPRFIPPQAFEPDRLDVDFLLKQRHGLNREFKLVRSDHVDSYVIRIYQVEVLCVDAQIYHGHEHTAYFSLCVRDEPAQAAECTLHRGIQKQDIECNENHQKHDKGDNRLPPEQPLWFLGLFLLFSCLGGIVVYAIRPALRRSFASLVIFRALSIFHLSTFSFNESR